MYNYSFCELNSTIMDNPWFDVPAKKLSLHESILYLSLL